MTPNFSGSVRTLDFSYEINTNAYGFRFQDTLVADSSALIGFFGDSFTFGQGLNEDETYSHQLEKLAPGIKAFNTGTCGYSPTQERRVYESLKDKMKFKHVVLQICENDIIVQGRTCRPNIYNGILYNSKPEGILSIVKSWIALHSEFYCQLYYLKEQFQERNKKETPFAHLVDQNFSEKNKAEIESTVAFIKDWAADVKKQTGNKLIVMFIPHRVQVEPGWRLKLDPSRTNPDASYSDIDRALKLDSDLSYIALLPLFREKQNQSANKTSFLYFERNGHTNANGHRLMADALAAHLKSLN
jgi:lysophospholipase L1-like esterase